MSTVNRAYAQRVRKSINNRRYASVTQKRQGRTQSESIRRGNLAWQNGKGAIMERDIFVQSRVSSVDIAIIAEAFHNEQNTFESMKSLSGLVNSAISELAKLIKNQRGSDIGTPSEALRFLHYLGLVKDAIVPQGEKTKGAVFRNLRREAQSEAQNEIGQESVKNEMEEAFRKIIAKQELERKLSEIRSQEDD